MQQWPYYQNSLVIFGYHWKIPNLSWNPDGQIVVLSLLGAANDDNGADYNIIFTIKDTKIYDPVVTLLTKD